MKKLMVSAMMALLGGTLFAAGDMYLYWMIAEDATVKDAQGQAVSMDGMTASIHYTDGSGAETGLLNLYDSSYESFGTEIAVDGVQGFPVLAGVTGYENYSFFVELSSDAGVFRSTTASYSSLASYISSMSGIDYPATGGYGFGNFSVAPEPTSGLLLLLGVAGLMLRRRRA